MDAHGSHIYSGNYSQYMDHKIKVKETKEKNNTSYIENKKAQSLQRKHQNQIKKIEKEISTLENQIKEWNLQLQEEDVLNDYKKYNEVVQKIDDGHTQLDQLLEQWENMQQD